MPNIEHSTQTATHPDHAMPIDMDAALFVALELSLSSWVVVASAPGEDKASKQGVAACDGPGLLALLDRLRQRAEARCRHPVAVVVMQEAGRDGFWVHRLLDAQGMRSQVVDPSSIAVNRRSRRAKTDRGERATGEEDTPAAALPSGEGPGARLLRLKGIGPPLPFHPATPAGTFGNSARDGLSAGWRGILS